MNTEPSINVGVLTSKSIDFVLNGEFICSNGQVYFGQQTAEYQEGKVFFDGQKFDELTFEPLVLSASFDIIDVIIGINFHWERKENQRFKGALQLIVDSEQLTAPDKILRIETVYRRHNERSDKFFSDENISRLCKNFYIDWKDLFFFRTVRAYKGARKSEVERANIIINHGADEYLKRSKAEMESGKITPKQYRTIREFIRDYEEDSKRFRTIVSAQEKEYNSLLYRVYDITKK